MTDFTKEIQQVIDSEESKDLISTMNGEVVSTDRQLKNGTLVYKEPNNKTWLIYANGYIRVGRPLADRLGVVRNPGPGDQNYKDTGVDYYIQFAIPFIKEKYLNIKNRDAKRWKKITKKSHEIIPAFFEMKRIQELIIQYYTGKRDFNDLYNWLNKLN